jgi:hypothetical protein
MGFFDFKLTVSRIAPETLNPQRPLSGRRTVGEAFENPIRIRRKKQKRNGGMFTICGARILPADSWPICGGPDLWPTRLAELRNALETWKLGSPIVDDCQQSSVPTPMGCDCDCDLVERGDDLWISPKK